MFKRQSDKKQKRLEDKIKEFIVARLNLPVDPGSIGDNQPLFGERRSSLNLDSIDGLELATGVKQEFDIIIEEDIDPTLFATVSSIAEFIRTNMPDVLDEYADYEVN
jgi:acyl carrier protein